MKRPMMTTGQSTDFDVISGPSMASACPVVDSVPAERAPAKADAASASPQAAPAEATEAAA